MIKSAALVVLLTVAAFARAEPSIFDMDNDAGSFRPPKAVPVSETPPTTQPSVESEPAPPTEPKTPPDKSPAEKKPLSKKAAKPKEPAVTKVAPAPVLKAGAVIDSPEAILAALPASAYPKDAWTAEDHAAVSNKLAAAVMSHPARYRGVVAGVSKSPGAIILRFVHVPTPHNLKALYYFRAPLSDPTMAKVAVGDTVTVNGTFARVQTKKAGSDVLVADIIAPLPATTRTFHSMQEITKLIPPGATGKADDWSAEQAESATKSIQAAALNQTAAISLKVDKVELLEKGPWAGQYRVHGEAPAGESLKTTVYCYISLTVPKDRAAGLPKSSTVQVTGVICRCDVSTKGLLTINLDEATLAP